MSVFINNNSQLIDTDFFGKRIKYKLPRWVKLKRDIQEFQNAHNIIKRWAIFRNYFDLTTKEIKFIVHEYFEGSEEDKG